MSELIKVLGYTSCVIVGHDWGGAVAWQFVARYPDLVEKFIIMNIPHPGRFTEVMKSGIAQLLMSWWDVFLLSLQSPESCTCYFMTGFLFVNFGNCRIVNLTTHENKQAVQTCMQMACVNHYKTILQMCVCSCHVIVKIPCGRFMHMAFDSIQDSTQTLCKGGGGRGKGVLIGYFHVLLHYNNF